MDIIVPNGNEMHSVMYGWVYWSAWYQDIPLYARVIESILLLKAKRATATEKMTSKDMICVSRNVSHGR